MAATIVGRGKCPQCKGWWAIIDAQNKGVYKMRRHFAHRLADADGEGRCKGSGSDPTEYTLTPPEG